MMFNAVFEFLSKYSSLIVTTHDIADADGLGAEKVFAQMLKTMGKQARIVNSSPVPDNFRFIDRDATVETWENARETLPPEAALVMLDTADEYNIGELKNLIPKAPEVFVIDHHEPNQFCTFKGFFDSTASSTSELAVELAQAAGVKLTFESAAAAYAGIVYDTGFFAFPKTTARTFRVALSLVEAGVNPNAIYQELNENASTGMILLQKAVLSTLEIHMQGRVAVQVLRKEDLESSGARFEDAENFINVPLKSREIEVSIMIKENREGQIRCSLRSKGKVNVSRIAQSLGGGGHVSAAGFKSSMGAEETLATVLAKVKQALPDEAPVQPGDTGGRLFF